MPGDSKAIAGACRRGVPPPQVSEERGRPVPAEQGGVTPPTLRSKNSSSRLPEIFYSRVEPVRVPEPRLIRVNEALAEHLGIDRSWLRSDAAVRTFAGNEIPAGAEPI